MDSQVGESSSRETQLEKEILQLKKENENLRALNISLQQGIFSYICISVDISIYLSVWLSVIFFLFFFFKKFFQCSRV